MILWRAADDDSIDHTASFSACREHAEAYLRNPGFGGRVLHRARVQIDPAALLDLYDLSSDDAVQALLSRISMDRVPAHAIGLTADVLAPQLQSELEAAGIQWVRVRDTYPDDCETYIWISGDEPELVAV